MTTITQLDKIGIDVKSHRLLKQLLQENPKLDEIMRNAKNEIEVLIGVRNWGLTILEESPDALAFYRGEQQGPEVFAKLRWRDYAAIRLLDYVDNAGREFPDLNLGGEIAVSNPLKLIWLGVNFGTGGAKPFFFEDMLHLFRQLTDKEKRDQPSNETVQEWMDRYPSGLDPRIVKLREENRDRIINLLIDAMERDEIKSHRFNLDDSLSREQKFLRVLSWWQEDHRFHLGFAVRSPDLLNRLLGDSLDPDTMKLLHRAEERGIPFFVNPYYLSLVHVRVPYFAIGADMAIRHYILYSEQLVEEFGNIVAWEKEDLVEPGKPNAAGWLLPSASNVHRRYPDVAILIPDTVGRACGGLCASCQRMYDFQRGHLNFNLEGLKPKESWKEKLERLMDYFENDAQLRDILITGGDGLMSSDHSLKELLDAIYRMAVRKRDANKSRADGEKYAEIVRVRIGTRLPIYLPQRITPALIAILQEFKERAVAIGIRQFVIQTHFESPMEVTPESRGAVQRLLSAGWTVTNQLVMTTAACRRGHAAKLRLELNKVGVLPYYSFAVKGYMENNFSYAPIARIVQEGEEEKSIGRVAEKYYHTLRGFPMAAEKMVANIEKMQQEAELPFLATDRSVLNLPGVGKSLTFRVIGITRYGRRILAFDHDPTRAHSPITKQMGKIVIIESKSIAEYLAQLDALGEDVREYASLYGFSLGETEPRMPLYEYPPYDFSVTEEITNLELTKKSFETANG